ncbi:MAG: hypothetical protein GXP54_04090, partial [Deltaproteobacteria bacterium]|nr:hypothetical protein [Deltaproteobacteria bacterium]
MSGQRSGRYAPWPVLILACMQWSCGSSSDGPIDSDSGLKDVRLDIVVPKDKIGKPDSDMGESEDAVEAMTDQMTKDTDEPDAVADIGGSDVEPPHDLAKEAGPLSGQVKVVPELLDFGFVPGGQEGKIPFAVKNMGPGALILDKFTIAGAPEISLQVGFDPKVLSDHVEYDVQPDVLLKA